MRTLRNYCIDMLRRNKQRQKMMEAAASEVQIQQYDDDPNDAEERYRQLDQAIATLTQQEQRVINMKYVKQLTINEIAQQTGFSETNITTMLSRAYAKLRFEISKQQPI
jgi:RNA polymerase sigma factor (sigma-70 family)